MKLSFMKKIFLLILVIISVAAIHSCQKETSGEPGNTPTGSEVDVYVAGFELNSAGISVAKYGKNGQAVSLTDGTHDAYRTSPLITGSSLFISCKKQRHTITRKQKPPLEYV